ncbi:IS982 family transposase [Enterococcus sp. DIV0187]|uniref:IS982 family transposase n=1 Tax=Enterococcus sp. DIV0187 TaxID=2774644 RepID=UPI003F685E5E
MQSQTKYIEIYTNTQLMFSEILEIIQSLYKRYVPAKIKNRKNTHLLKQPDTVIISCVIWGMMNGLTTQRAIYRSVRSVLALEHFPDRSRFTRLCVNLTTAIKLIRYRFVIEHANPKDQLFAIIDSFPSPLCKPVRNRRAKVLSEVADIGYNSTKKLYFYGLKISVMVTKTGFPLTYTVTKASIHDVNMAETLAFDCPIEKLLGDKGYVSSDMQKRLLNKGIELSTPVKKNAKNNNKLNDSLLSEHRKVIETVFSSWENFGIQNFKSRSLLGGESRLESILLVYCLMLSKAQERYGETLKYSLGRF